jgi:FixJ family two-component response regulator
MMASGADRPHPTTDAAVGLVASPQAEPKADGGSLEYLVAIIDDDPSVRLATESLIKSLGHASMTFASAEDFLGSPLLANITCLITDVQMPGMNGIELRRVLIAQHRRLPVIFITAYPENRVREQALSAGALGFLSKPFASDDLIHCLEAALQQSGSAES